MARNIYKSKKEYPEAVLPSCPVVQKLKGQTAIVTGANSGIGKAVAVAMGCAGANVVINYLSDEENVLAEMSAEIERCGGRTIGFQADISSEDEVKAMFDKARETYGTVDIMVNNAGLQQDAPIEDMSLKQWQKVINVNLTGQFLCSREAVREFKRSGVKKEVSCAAGKIICISSVHEVIPWAGHVNYAASKGGVMMMMKSIAQEVAPYRIRVNSICPGAIKTHINTAAWSTPEAEAELLKLIPYQRVGEPDDIARVAVWLASDDADYINGTSIFVDGGMTLYPGFTENG